MKINENCEALYKDSGCYHFCVLTGKEYVLKAIALHHSLRKHADHFRLWICCVDFFTYTLLKKMNLENAVLLRVEEMEDDRLREIKGERTTKEYCWTLKPILIEHVMSRYKVPSVLYCDGDMYFFSDPKPIFDEWGEHDVFLCLQRDADWVLEKYGKYQAGLIGFKNEANGLESLNWWKERCLEWCFAEPEQGRFGDQKYLDNLTDLFSKVQISENLGVDAAPWNCIYHNNFIVSAANNRVYIEEDKLVAFHFACVSIFSENEFDLWTSGPLPISSVIMHHIYEPYLENLMAIMEKVKSIDIHALSQCLCQDRSNAQTFYQHSNPIVPINPSDRSYHFATIVSQEYLIKGLAFYYSLEKRISKFHLWICCMDDMTYQTLSKMKLEKATLIHVNDVENEQLRQAKSARKLYEYCWTLKAPVCLYILDHHEEIDHIVYCDADLYFFSDPKPVYDEWGNASVFLCRQRGTQELENMHGTYQAGLIGFRRDEQGDKILHWWKDKCIDNCFDIYENDSWGDQKYLDRIPHLFSDFTLIGHIGINAAPWNLVMNNHHNVMKKETEVFIDDSPLIAFHFGSMLILKQDEFDLWKLEHLAFNQSVIDHIYVPYIRSLQSACHILKKLVNTDISHFFANPPSAYSPKNFLKL